MPISKKPRASAGRPITRNGRKYRDPMPHNVKPMLATLFAKPFDRKDWIFEVKWDGFRAIAEIEKGKVRIYSRNLLSFIRRFSPVADALAGFHHDAVLDGEIIVVDDQGRSQFQLLQNYQRTGEGNLAYYVFDLLYLDGEDLRVRPLRERKQRLASILTGLPNVRFSEHIEEHGVSFFKTAAKHGLEGIVAKNTASTYQAGSRSWDWLKIKARRQQEAVIGGFTEPRGSRDYLGALVLGVYDGDDLVYVGHSGGGFNARTRREMREMLKPLIQEQCPFKKKPKTNSPAHWVKPVKVCEVLFQEWTEDGQMRHPIYAGLREDKPARVVRRELPKNVPLTPRS